jgi:hypothetical protein
MDSEYIINQKSKVEYRIAKFMNGHFTTEYTVDIINKKSECSCISGMYRGYCKHKDWVNSLRKNRELPDFVTIAKEVTQKDLDNLMEELK